MSDPLVLVTGFGPFEKVRTNPSRAIATALAGEPPAGVRIVAAELPVSFTAAPLEVERFVARHARRRPALLLGLGVQREGWFRLETRARGRYTTSRIDNDGLAGAAIGASAGRTLRTSADVRALAKLLRECGAEDVRISNDAGGYVCERTYHALLTAGEEHDVETVFLHVPPVRFVRTPRQVRLVREWLAAWREQR